MELEPIKSKTEDLIDHISDYTEARWNLAVLDTAEKTSEVVSSLATITILGLSIGLGLIFLSTGIAWWIGQQLHSISLGFFIVAAFYAFLSIILYLIKDTFIKIPVVNSIIRKFYHES